MSVRQWVILYTMNIRWIQHQNVQHFSVDTQLYNEHSLNSISEPVLNFTTIIPWIQHQNEQHFSVVHNFTEWNSLNPTPKSQVLQCWYTQLYNRSCQRFVIHWSMQHLLILIVMNTQSETDDHLKPTTHGHTPNPHSFITHNHSLQLMIFQNRSPWSYICKL
jgi:hypothetical protein